MKALTFVHSEHLELVNKENPQIEKEDEVIVKIISSGICGTDLKIFQGKFAAKQGVTLGHEAVGIVNEVGPAVHSLKPNDYVVIDPTYYCGVCDYCLRGKVNCCDNKMGRELGVDYDGTHAEFCKLPARFVHKLPNNLSLKQAVLIEPLACIINNLTAAQISPGERILIYGGGPIGLLSALLCQYWGSQVCLVETNPKRAAFARLRLNYVIEDETQMDLEKNRKPDVIIDSVGRMLEQAMQRIAKGGKIVLMGFNNMYQATIKPLDLTLNGIKLIGAGDYKQHIPIAIDLIQSMKLDDLITHQFSLNEFSQAFHLLNHPQDNQDIPMKITFIPHLTGDV